MTRPPWAKDLPEVSAATLLARFNGRLVSEIRAMGGANVDDFTGIVALPPQGQPLPIQALR